MLCTEQPKRLKRIDRPASGPQASPDGVTVTLENGIYRVSHETSRIRYDTMRALGIGVRNREGKYWEIKATPENRQKLIDAGFLLAEAPHIASARQGMMTRQAAQAQKPAQTQRPQQARKRPGMMISKEAQCDNPPMPACPAKPEEPVRVIDGFYHVAIGYDKEKVEALRLMPDAHFDRDTKEWIAPKTALATMILSGLGLCDPDPGPDFARIDASRLLPFQLGGVKALCARQLTALLNDPAGREAQCVAAVAAMNAYPCVITCPKSKAAKWESAIAAHAPDARVVRLTEKNAGLYPPAYLMDEIKGTELYARELPYEKLADADIYLCDFEALRIFGRSLAGLPNVVIAECHRLGRRPMRKTKDRHGKDIYEFDESAATNEGYAWRILEKAYRKLFVSGYRVDRKAKRFYDILRRLAPGRIGGFQDYGQKYCDAEPDDSGYAPSGYRYEGASNIGELFDLLGDALIRRSPERVASEASGLPEEAREAMLEDIRKWRNIHTPPADAEVLEAIRIVEEGRKSRGLMEPLHEVWRKERGRKGIVEEAGKIADGVFLTGKDKARYISIARKMKREEKLRRKHAGDLGFQRKMLLMALRRREKELRERERALEWERQRPAREAQWAFIARKMEREKLRRKQEWEKKKRRMEREKALREEGMAPHSIRKGA